MTGSGAEGCVVGSGAEVQHCSVTGSGAEDNEGADLSAQCAFLGFG